MAWRMLLLFSVTVAFLAASPTGAEIYRCVLPDGSVRFTDAAASCEGAVAHESSGRLERTDPDSALAPAVTPSAVESLLLTSVEAGSGWEIVAEVPVDPRADPDMVEWGVTALAARRYTRELRGIIQVCSVELWSFASLEQAAAAEAHFHYPDWRIAREGALLLMVHGSEGPRGLPPRRGVFPACAALSARVHERARR